MVHSKGGVGEHTAFRIPEEILKRVDAFAEQRQAEQLGQRVSRSDALRLLLVKGLEVVEAEGKRKSKRKT